MLKQGAIEAGTMKTSMQNVGYAQRNRRTKDES